MRRLAPLILLVLACATAPPAVCGEAAGAPGVEIGAVAPDFTLPDPSGVAHHLAEMRGKKNVVLVFFRGTW